MLSELDPHWADHVVQQRRLREKRAPRGRRATRKGLIAVGALLMACGAVIAPYPVVSMAFWVPGLGIILGATSR